MKRICLFAGYSSNNTIEDYVVYFIEQLSKYSDVYYYCDSDLDKNELKKLKPYVKGAYGKRHKKYDYGSWQELVKEIGKEKIRKYDELILTNDSCYGPLFPLDNVFETMENKKNDFWGLSASIGYHIHLQSYFLVFNKSVISTDYLFDFLDNVKQEKSLREVCDNYEDMLTYVLSQKGFKYDSYIPLDDRVLHPYFQTWDCIKEKKFPLLKVKTFYGLAGKQPIKDYKKFISENTEYDYKLIERDLKNRGLTNKEIKKNISQRRGESFGFKIKKVIAKPVIVFWNKYISKFDKRFDRNNENVSNSYMAISRQLTYIERRLDNLYDINNYENNEIEKFMKEHNNTFEKYNVVPTSVMSKVDFIDNSILFNNVQEFFRLIAEHKSFNKKRFIKTLFYGSYNIGDLTKYYINNGDMLVINQKDDNSIEHKLLSSKISNCDSNFIVTDSKEENVIFNIIFVNGVTLKSDYDSVVDFYKNILNLMDNESILITSANKTINDRKEDFMEELGLGIDFYTEDMFRYTISSADKMQMLFLKKSVKSDKKNN